MNSNPSARERSGLGLSILKDEKQKINLITLSLKPDLTLSISSPTSSVTSVFHVLLCLQLPTAYHSHRQQKKLHSFPRGGPYHVSGRARHPISSLPGFAAFRASVSTLINSTSRGADGVKRKPGHWFPPKMLTRTRFSLLCPSECGGSEEEASRIPSTEEQLLGELNIAFANGWSADCVRLAICLVGSCLCEVGVVWPLLQHPCQTTGSPQGRAVYCGGSTRSTPGRWRKSGDLSS